MQGGIFIAFISQDDINAIKNQNDIVEVISSYVPLDKKGKEYVGICPFHNDHDPSMRVSQQKQIYKCFVCGAGGNVFTFLQKIENISFQESVLKAAKRISYPLANIPSIQPRKDPLQPALDVLSTFIEYCNYQLYSREGMQALEYLRSRKFSDEIIREYKIGYAPNARAIQAFFKAKGLDPARLLEAGLVSDQGELDQPFFYERIIIPIRDAQGRFCGITARTLLQDKSVPKYINTTNTPLYHKGSLLFNYDLAREAGRKAGRLILVEGAMDVLGLAKAGLKEGIAALGTAMTDEQLEMISRLRLPVSVFYDNDRAGKDAVYKFGMKAMEAGIRFSVINNTYQKDPDEIFIASGREVLQSAVGRTISFVDFCFDYLQLKYDLHNYEDKKEYAGLMASIIRKLADRHEAPGYYDKLNNLTNFDYSSQPLDDQPDYSSYKKYQKQKASYTNPKMEAGRLRAEKSILQAMLYGYGFVERFKDEIGFFSDPVCQDLSLYVYEAYRTNETIDPAGLIDAIEEEDCRNLLVELFSENADLVLNEQFFSDAIMKIKESSLEQRIEQINQKIKNNPDPEQAMALAMEKQQLIMQKHQMRFRKEN